MIQRIFVFGLLTLVFWPGEAQPQSHYNYSSDKYQKQFREAGSCDLSWKSYDRQRGIEGRYWTVAGENSPLPKTLGEQLEMQGMAGEHVGSQGRGYSGVDAGGYTQGYGYDEGYGGGYSEGYVEGYGGEVSRGAGRGARTGYDRELIPSSNSDMVIRPGPPGVGQ